jgi:glutathione peroxidase
VFSRSEVIAAPSLHSFHVRTLDGHGLGLGRFSGRPLLIVNTAGHFSCSRQFTGLERLHRRYSGRGLVVLGFPCGQFALQDCGSDFGTISVQPGTDRTSFLMMERVEVRGPRASPLFRWLMDQAPGMLGTRAIKWDFTKFLVQRDGRSVRRFAPRAMPESLIPAIEDALRK